MHAEEIRWTAGSSVPRNLSKKRRSRKRHAGLVTVIMTLMNLTCVSFTFCPLRLALHLLPTFCPPHPALYLLPPASAACPPSAPPTPTPFRQSFGLHLASGSLRLGVARFLFHIVAPVAEHLTLISVQGNPSRGKVSVPHALPGTSHRAHCAVVGRECQPCAQHKGLATDVVDVQDNDWTWLCVSLCVEGGCMKAD